MRKTSDPPPGFVRPVLVTALVAALALLLATRARAQDAPTPAVEPSSEEEAGTTDGGAEPEGAPPVERHEAADVPAQVAPRAEELAAAAADRGLSFGLRVGYAAPTNSDFFSGAVPFWLDVGYRVSDRLYVGVQGHYGYALVQACSSPFTLPSSCSTSSGRTWNAGVNARYHFARKARLDPWLGLGVGYQHETERMTFPPIRALLSDEGYQLTRPLQLRRSTDFVELINLQAGIDLRIGQSFRVGPFSSASFLFSGRRFQSWLTLGVRGQYDL